jgi:YrbI family 3-deoxy-D-manno-octulosonate 8-phosphate phosphatase
MFFNFKKLFMVFKKLELSCIDAIVFDFDGVLTNNMVHLDQNGQEWVSCSRSDGLAFDVFRELNIPVYILSTEKNLVVKARAKKLQVPSIQGVSDKRIALEKIVKENNFCIEKVLYVGNDLNDYRAISVSGYSACPADSHSDIKKHATYVLNTNGGMGVAREILEDIMHVDVINTLYK